MISVNVDGRVIEVQEGASALDALHIAGLEVPTACSDPRVSPSGSCRLCLVNLKGSNRSVTACALKVYEGMEIEVDTPELHAARRGELQLLARNYPVEYVDEFPEKTFHHWLKVYGLVPEGHVATERSPIDATNPYFRFDPDACIKCFRCVKVCDELQGSFVWNVLDRGSETHVIPDSMTTMAESNCKSCGACADACPTGALVDKTRIEMGQPDKWTRTTCPYCGVGCELSVGTKGNQIVQVLPVLDAHVSKGHLCVKGRYAHQYVHAKDRLTEPMLRKNGELVAVSWDEAISFIASEFKRISDTYGPGSIGVLGSARSPNEDNYVAQKFARVVIGTNNVDCCARVCHGPSAAAMKAMLGTGAATNSYNDLERAKTIMIVGCNPIENHPIVGDRIRQAVLKSTNLIVIDPRAIEMAEIASVHVAPQPGTNVPLFHAMANVILNEGLADQEFLDTRVDEVDQFHAFVNEWTPERASEVCGVPAETIRAAARLYASAKPSMCFHGLGVTEHLQGTEGVMSLVNLALLTGNIGKPGTGINPLRGQNNVQGSAHMGCEPSNLTGYVSIEENRERFAKVWNAPIPHSKGLTQVQMLAAAGEGKVKALWSIGYDVYFTNPTAHKSRAQFEAMELVIVQDLFLNETAREFAHVLLPAASSFERDGTFMNAERRIQMVRQAIDPVGNSKPDWEIIQLVAQKMGVSEGFSFGSADEIWEEVRKVWTPGAGISYKRIEKHGLQWPCLDEDHPGTQILHKDRFPIGVKAPLKRIVFTPTPEVTSKEFPFLLNTGRTLYHFNAGTMTARTRNMELRPTDTLDIHPTDAKRIGVLDGEVVRLVSAYGCAELPIRHSRGLRLGELFATFHAREVFLNLITSQVKDPIGTPEYKVTAVRIERIPVIAGR